MTAYFLQNKHSKDRERNKKGEVGYEGQKPQSSYNLALELTAYQVYCVLFIRSESRSPAYTQVGKGYISIWILGGEGHWCLS